MYMYTTICHLFSELCVRAYMLAFHHLQCEKLVRVGCIFYMAIGLSDVPGESMVKLYCPKCCDVYTPKSSRHHHIDGVYFGTGFPHMLFMVHPELRPSKPSNQFVPRLEEWVG